ncbi:MAG: hypothetical protein K2V38_16675 [Gemmataceae bacterium]|nr:hypothetical protein [Gemmataceae bacterium]
MTTLSLDWAESRTRDLREWISAFSSGVAPKAAPEQLVWDAAETLRGLRGEHGRGFVAGLEADYQNWLEQSLAAEALDAKYQRWREEIQASSTKPSELTSELARAEETAAVFRRSIQAIAELIWGNANRVLDVYTRWMDFEKQVLAVVPHGPFEAEARDILGELKSLTERVRELLRLMLVARGATAVDELPADVVSGVLTVRITPLAYLRAMWNLFWSAIRYPFSETTIDLSTGRVLYRA